MYNIFVSYAQTQVSWAMSLQTHLTMPEVACFVAQKDLPPGESLSDVIASQIKQCDLFILLWTHDAAASKYVASEIFVAKTEKKKILPILMERGTSLPSIIGDVKYLDLLSDPSSQLAWLRALVEKESRSKARGDAIVFGVLAFLTIAALTSK